MKSHLTNFVLIVLFLTVIGTFFVLGFFRNNGTNLVLGLITCVLGFTLSVMQADKKERILAVALVCVVSSAGAFFGTEMFRDDGFKEIFWVNLISNVSFVLGVFLDNLDSYYPKNISSRHQTGRGGPVQ